VSLAAVIPLALASLALPATMQSAEAVIYKPKASYTTDKGGIWMFSGWDGSGDADWVPAGTTTRLGWVKSFRVPANCAGYKSGIMYWSKRKATRDVELTGLDYRVTLRLRCD
jgi:hypothetical protein